MKLETWGYELMYLNEFAINSIHKSVYGWGPKGNNGFKNNYANNFSISFMIGFSIRKFYGILGTTAIHSHKFFITFICNIIDHRRSLLSLEESKFIIVWDNSYIP